MKDEEKIWSAGEMGEGGEHFSSTFRKELQGSFMGTLNSAGYHKFLLKEKNWGRREAGCKGGIRQ